MEQTYTIKEILDSQLAKNIIKTLFQNQEIELIERPASFIIRLKYEPEDKLFRIILLPPHGFSGNKIDETNPHPEIRKAKIEFKGGIRPNKSGFNLLKNVLKYQYYTTRNVKITEDNPYPKIGGLNYKEEINNMKIRVSVMEELFKNKSKKGEIDYRFVILVVLLILLYLFLRQMGIVN